MSSFSRLHKVLKGNISKIDNEKREELDLRASSIICMPLAKNILANVLGTSSTKELSEKLEGLYQGKDKVLKLIWSLPSSYEHIKPVLIYRKETLSFEEVASKIISEERRLKGEDNTLSNSVLVARGRPYVKKKMKRVRDVANVEILDI
ncbi:unnamed protein product [Vicia faba]|uniref:Uncharacterized protein n=1 Tax=Vicia faba TaxID=3906 RepID=A0AAV0YMC6_VICFA|nr:unnamed protein product [Vicia faba]